MPMRAIISTDQVTNFFRKEKILLLCDIPMQKNTSVKFLYLRSITSTEDFFSKNIEGVHRQAAAVLARRIIHHLQLVEGRPASCRCTHRGRKSYITLATVLYCFCHPIKPGQIKRPRAPVKQLGAVYPAGAFERVPWVGIAHGHSKGKVVLPFPCRWVTWSS